MMPRKDIEKDNKSYERLTLEVLLDIRDLLEKQAKAARKQKRAAKPKTTK